MSLSELQKYTAVSKYARWVEGKKRRETWGESVGRVESMMLGRFPSLEREIREAYAFVREVKVLGSQRALQFGGPPVLQHNGRLFNCCSSFCDRLRFFQECFYLLLCGCGTGFSVQEHHVASLPGLSTNRQRGVALPRKTFRVPDSIEGWADAAGVLLSSYHDDPVFPEYHDCEVDFDFSLIRREGSPLSFGIGRAPGPEPLRVALGRVRALLERAVNLGMRKLNSLFSYDTVMHLSDAVLAGGVRRSASICIFSPWDKDMIEAKTGAWMDTNPQRARSNNSAAILRRDVTFGEFEALFRHTREFGDPGIWLTDNNDIICNPCGEVAFFPVLKVPEDHPLALSHRHARRYPGGQVGLSGFHFCNLTTVNGKTVRDADDFLTRCEAAAVIGTLQASFTDFPYLGPVTEAIARQEALLGVSLSGAMHHAGLLLDPALQRAGAARVRRTNERVAARIGINPAARLTVVKPDGNSSCVMGSEPGIHAGHSKRYFRIQQANVAEAPYQFFRSVNPDACETSQNAKGGRTDCIRFCIEEPEGTVLKEHLSAIDQLENVRRTFLNWVREGKVWERCAHPDLMNNVSNTITVAPDEWDAVARHIYEHRECYAGVTLVPASCDRDFYQAPYTAVYTPGEQESLYGHAAVRGAGDLVLAAAGRGFRDLWDACDMVLGLWAPGRRGTAGQEGWAAEVRGFAAENFAGDNSLRVATYALKDWSNWALWCKLKETTRPVDYADMTEEENTTNLQGESGCSGGACLV